jgi:hypothetical protein
MRAVSESNLTPSEAAELGKPKRRSARTVYGKTPSKIETVKPIRLRVLCCAL